ncbi:MAG TPA: hypothetical protein VF901_21915 [Bradyrhizobium sp.]
MAVVTTKSASITAMDSTPLVEITSGEGISGFMKTVNDSVTGVVGDSIASIYRFVRIPTTAKVKAVKWNLFTASTAGATDFDVAFSDSAVDGTPQSLAGGVVQVSGPVDNKMFGSATALTATTKVNADITFANTFLAAHQNLPLWQVLVNLLATQFTADPGGYFDIVAKLTTALTVTAGVISMEVDYVQGP